MYPCGRGHGIVHLAGRRLIFRLLWTEAYLAANSEKGQFKLGRLRIKDNRAPKIWTTVLAA